MAVFRSNIHIYAQIVDDDTGTTLASASSLKIELPPADEPAGDNKKKKRPESVKMRRSRHVGQAIAQAALEKGIKVVAFDRGGFLYHGRLAALAETARKSGLEF